MQKNIEFLIQKVQQKRIWHEEPVFCFTSDVDWASEAVLDDFFNVINPLNLNPTIFVTHDSKVIEEQYTLNQITRGIHPNFLSNSSHGDHFKEVIETCVQFAPESIGFRSHRLFDVTDITHMLANEFNFKYVSNLGTILQTNILPILHESGLVHYPIFFEDGTHLYNQLQLDITAYQAQLQAPGIKIISFHPMNFVFNSPELTFMRGIKDSMSREAYNQISPLDIKKLQNNKKGIRDTVLDIIEFVNANNYRVMSMNDIYDETLS